jgi:hypothetical protein
MGRKAEVAAAALALALAGCASPHPTQVESAGGAADALIKACAAGRTRAALELLTPAARQVFVSSPDGCRRLLGLPARGTRVVSVHANDLTATAELSGGSRLELEKSRGAWAVTSAR